MRENILRAENGFPLRKYYALYEGSQRPYLPSLITNPKCLVNLINGKNEKDFSIIMGIPAVY